MFACLACKQTFLSEMMCKYHDCPEKKEDEDEFKCLTCGKKYWSERMLEIHKKTHINYDDMDDDIADLVIKMPKLIRKVVIDDDEELVSLKIFF